MDFCTKIELKEQPFRKLLMVNFELLTQLVPHFNVLNNKMYVTCTQTDDMLGFMQTCARWNKILIWVHHKKVNTLGILSLRVYFQCFAAVYAVHPHVCSNNMGLRNSWQQSSQSQERVCDRNWHVNTIIGTHCWNKVWDKV